MSDTHDHIATHRLPSLIDRLSTRVADDVTRVHDVARGWDPSFVRRVLPMVDAYIGYFDAEVEGFERVPPRGPMLLVGNHSGGMYMPDSWAFFRTWIRERGLDEPLYGLGFDLMFSIPGMGPLVRRLGIVPASHDNAGRLLDAGKSVMVYPGGDEDVFRPWVDRNHLEFHRRTGFVRLALRHRVPVVPVVSHGSHSSLVVLSRGDALARMLHLERVRVHILPVLTIPVFPLPAKVTVRVCEPFDWRSMPPEAADDPTMVRHCYEQVVGRMQSTLDDLAAARPHPIVDRLRDPLRHGSSERAQRAAAA